MYNRIFKTLENRFKEYESLEKYLDSHIEELQARNHKLVEQVASLKEQVKILEVELNAAYSIANIGLTE